MCRFLEVSFDEGMTEVSFRRNSSFRTDRERSAVLSVGERRLVDGLVPALDSVPTSVFRLCERIALTASGRRELPFWFFRLLSGAPDETASLGVRGGGDPRGSSPLAERPT